MNEFTADFKVTAFVSGASTISGACAAGSFNLSLNNLDGKFPPAGSYEYTQSEREKIEEILDKAINDFTDVMEGMHLRLLEEQ